MFCFCQREPVADASLGGLFSTPPAISFHTLKPIRSRRTGWIAEQTVLVVEPTWLWLITRGSRWAVNKHGREIVKNILILPLGPSKAVKLFFFTQEFVSNIVRNFMGDGHQWTKGSWIGITDTLTEGTWVWINNVTEVEQRWELQNYTVNVILFYDIIDKTFFLHFLKVLDGWGTKQQWRQWRGLWDCDL